MARAKRTERAEARRRNRAANLAAAGVVEEIGEETGDEAAAARPVGRTPRQGVPPRPGFLNTFRQAAGRPNFVEDIRALPQVALHSKALWLPLLVIAVTAGLFFIPGLQQNPLVAMLGQIALTPPPMIMPFLGGMLAPRAAWLVGGIIGLANAMGFLVLVLMNTSTQVTPLGWTYAVSNDQKLSYVINGLFTAIPFGILVGAFAGFYRRFLTASSPARAGTRQPARSNTRRR